MTVKRFFKMGERQFVFYDGTDESSIVLRHDGNEYQPEDECYRQRYSYVITTPEWEYVDNDIRSGCNQPVDLDKAVASLAGFLTACAESSEGGENYSIFPPHVRDWAYQNSDELTQIICDIEGDNNV